MKHLARIKYRLTVQDCRYALVQPLYDIFDLILKTKCFLNQGENGENMSNIEKKYIIVRCKFIDTTVVSQSSNTIYNSNKNLISGNQNGKQIMYHQFNPICIGSNRLAVSRRHCLLRFSKSISYQANSIKQLSVIPFL